MALRVTRESFIEKAKRIHTPSRYDYSLVDYKGCEQKVCIKCNFCDRTFWQTPHNHTLCKNPRGCPFCSQSISEKVILDILESHNINTEIQKVFPDCRAIYSLRFDFYLPDYNTCIEYNGQQHYSGSYYKNLGKLSSKKANVALKKRHLYDKIKRDFCEKNDIKLFEIKYTDIIEEKMLEIFNYIDSLKNT